MQKIVKTMNGHQALETHHDSIIPALDRDELPLSWYDDAEGWTSIAVSSRIAGELLHGRPERRLKSDSGVYQLHARGASRHAHRLTRDDALAQEALQETTSFFLRWLQGESIQNARAWLHRVAHNYVCDFLKTAAVERLCHWRTPEKTASGRAGHADADGG